MDKKKVIILLSSLFLFLLIGIFIIIGITNSNNHNDSNKNRENNHANTSQIKGGTSYKHTDVSGDYEKMLEEAKEQEKLAKLEKEKKDKEKKDKENKLSDTAIDNNSNTKTVKENGKTYIVDSTGGMIPKGSAGTNPVKSTKSNINLNKDITPMYKKSFKICLLQKRTHGLFPIFPL